LPGTILVVGGTGMLGVPIARRLQADGFAVRVFARDAEKARTQLGDAVATFSGDVGDRGALDRALAGCSGVHVSLRGKPVGENTFERVEGQGVANVLAAAARAGVERLTFNSDVHVTAAANRKIPQMAVKAACEAAIRASGIPHVIFRPSIFMEALRHAYREGRLLAPWVHSPYHLIAADDFAAMVSRAFQSPTAPSREIAVYGPQAVGFHAAIRRYAAVVHPGMRVYTVPLWAASLLGGVTRDPFLRTNAMVMRMYGRGEPGDPAPADPALGTPTTTYDAWLARQRPAAPRAA
jgi:uncharacterized protein YbjT (DUF2867 family)